MEILRLESIKKSFGNVIANDDITLTVNKGEILSLLGENGAGKTVLTSILYGLYSKDSGKIIFEGKELKINSPQDSVKAGIGMVHQEFSLIQRFSVLENVTLALRSAPALLNKAVTVDSIKKASKELDLKLEDKIDVPVHRLPVEDQQRVEILKAMLQNPKIIIFDEPDRTLAETDVKPFLAWLKRIKQKGYTIILITHHIWEALEASDRIAVLRKGKLVGVVETKKTNEKKLIKMIFGEYIQQKYNKKTVSKKNRVLEVNNLQVFNDRGIQAVDNVSLHINGGEIIGIAGVTGNGQTELAEAIVGMRKTKSGEIKYGGKNVIGSSPKGIQNKGVIFLAAGKMVVGNFSIKQNSILDYPENPAFHGKNFLNFLDWGAVKTHAEKIVEENRVVCQNVETMASKLSGGNKQRLALGRKVEAHPNLFICLYPTKDLDFKSTYQIHNTFVDLRNNGKSVLYFGTDLDALLDLSDRLYVIFRGKIVGEFSDLKKVSKTQIGKLMVGG